MSIYSSHYFFQKLCAPYPARAVFNVLVESDLCMIYGRIRWQIDWVAIRRCSNSWSDSLYNIFINKFYYTEFMQYEICNFCKLFYISILCLVTWSIDYTLYWRNNDLIDFRFFHHLWRTSWPLFISFITFGSNPCLLCSLLKKSLSQASHPKEKLIKLEHFFVRAKEIWPQIYVVL